MVERIDRDTGASLADVIDRILDKGVVINADIAVAVAGVELLGIKLRAALASFETAARYGLEFPSGVNLEAPAWRRLAETGAGLPAPPEAVMTVSGSIAQGGPDRDGSTH